MVEKVVSNKIDSLSLKQKVTLVDLERIFQEIRLELETEISQQPSDFLANMMLPQLPVQFSYYKLR